MQKEVITEKGIKDLLPEERQGEVLENERFMNANTGKTAYIESYGCQMNFGDSEIVASILNKTGYGITTKAEEADLILLNTCAIREKAEQTVRNRMRQLEAIKAGKSDALVGVLGCMAERLKKKLLEEEKVVDIVCGPDAYRSLPQLIAEAQGGQKAVNVVLSKEETYAEIEPLRLDQNGVTAFVSIMRGCDNMCSFCVVPFTRGRERSRDPETIVNECTKLFNDGYREVTLLGQNVDSYKWESEGSEKVSFAKLLEMVALVNPDLRVRFSTSHPKDMLDDVLYTMAKYENICNYIHLPIQSGNSRILKLMNRTHDREWYLQRISKIREIIPDCAISTDMISGFCTETEEEHKDSLSLMDEVSYDMAYMFFYSERPNTLAARKYEDNVPLEVKKRRLQEIIDLQGMHSSKRNQMAIGTVSKVLIEKESKRSPDFLCGRNDQNKMVVFPKGNLTKGTYVNVKIEEATSATLKGVVVEG